MNKTLFKIFELKIFFCSISSSDSDYNTVKLSTKEKLRKKVQMNSEIINKFKRSKTDSRKQIKMMEALQKSNLVIILKMIKSLRYQLNFLNFF